MRETGYYWVKSPLGWAVGFYMEDYYGRFWKLPLSEERLFDSHFTEINETRIKNPEEI
jgi:hypothetical protein